VIRTFAVRGYRRVGETLPTSSSTPGVHVNSFMPAFIIPVLAWAATAAELSPGVADHRHLEPMGSRRINNDKWLVGNEDRPNRDYFRITGCSELNCCNQPVAVEKLPHQKMAEKSLR